jgi:hypothetical protein
MIRTLLKLAIVALLANATWHLFGAYAPHYKLRDAVQYASQFRGDATDEALRSTILELATQFDVPITEADVAVTHDTRQTTVDISYVRLIDLAPGLTRRWPLSMHVETLNARPPIPSDLVPK